MKTLIEVKRVSKQFRGTPVLTDVDFRVRAGEVIGLIGANGAGKSTLINLLLGRLQPTGGSIQLWGAEPSQKKVHERLGVMFQTNLVMERICGRELLEMARSCYQQAMSLATLTTLCGLTAAQLEQPVNRLSGGQQRRLNFALALVGNPQLLILDEPTAGMDATSRFDFWQRIRSLAQRGTTIFVTSHYLAELETVVSRLILLQNHQIRYDGTFHQFQLQYSQVEVSFDSKLTTTQLTPLLTAGTLIDMTGYHQVWQTANATTFLQQLAPVLADCQNVAVGRNTLDQIFRQLTKEDGAHD